MDPAMSYFPNYSSTAYYYGGYDGATNDWNDFSRYVNPDGFHIEKKRLLPVHEAGHILLAHLFPRCDWHAFSQETAISSFFLH
ncbi:hypothetical protein L1987_13595 [Smallanthus sonchifolius]|uniref:Uncharacterized protein n=1 Tax=Smallanthus sonchifolius TaxID=185202 RepID=A0ACB9JKF0_9ASTR|nr:hypothetical protein L1987_13595 [Smallanthus sonchifolius]